MKSLTGRLVLLSMFLSTCAQDTLIAMQPSPKEKEPEFEQSLEQAIQEIEAPISSRTRAKKRPQPESSIDETPESPSAPASPSSSSSSSSGSPTISRSKRVKKETPKELKERIEKALKNFLDTYETTRIPAVSNTSPYALRAHQSMVNKRKDFIATSLTALRALLRQYRESGQDLTTLNIGTERDSRSLLQSVLAYGAWELLAVMLEVQPELLNLSTILERALSRDILYAAPASRRIPLLRVIIDAAAKNNKLDEFLKRNAILLNELIHYADDETLKIILRTLPSTSSLRARLQALDPSRINPLTDEINQEQEAQMRILVSQLPTVPTGTVNLARSIQQLPITRSQITRLLGPDFYS